LAEPLHWVIAAPVAVAGKGEHPVVAPDPTPLVHCDSRRTGLTPMKLLVMTTLQWRAAPPPLAEPLH